MLFSFRQLQEKCQYIIEITRKKQKIYDIHVILFQTAAREMSIYNRNNKEETKDLR